VGRSLLIRDRKSVIEFKFAWANYGVLLRYLGIEVVDAD